jgi:hypothetical protein
MSAPRLALSLTVLGLAACITDVDLGASHTQLAAPATSTFAVQGALCTPVVPSPVRLVLALDASQSIALTDPNGTRAVAVSNLLSGLPRDPDIGVAIALFRGSTVTWLTHGGQADFTPVTDLDAAAIDQLRARILNFTVGNGNFTDFVAPLSQIYGLLAQDLSRHQGPRETLPRYQVVFLSDGAPSPGQEDALLCGDAVRRIRQLKDLAEDVTLSTVHVFEPQLAACTTDAGVIVQPACGFADLPLGTCPALIVEQNSQRLARMAELGGGTFHDFRDGAPVTLDLTFAPVHRRLVLDKLIAANLSVPAASPAGIVDSDGDGLLDAAEQTEGTQALVADSDGDGFSDGVEVFFRSRGAALSPVRADPGCPSTLHDLDTDCDGLRDCDEQLIGSAANFVDSDADGVPDVVEYQLGSQPASRDLAGDPDQDARTTGEELAAHLDPQRAEVNPTTAYRTTFTQRAALEADGSQCWDFRVDDVRLTESLGGTNDLFVSFSMVWADQPAGHTFLRTSRHAVASSGGGVLSLAPADFGQCL